jgi:putative endonuclease
MDKLYFVYMVTNEHNTVLYTGVTNDLKARVSEHKSKTGSVFTQRYRAHKLVYYAPCENIEGAIWAEKKLKGLLRSKKNAFVAAQNPRWNDLYDEI